MFVREFYSLDPVVDGSGRRRDVIPVRIFTTTTAVMDGRLRDVIPVAAVAVWQSGTDDVTPVMVVDADTVVDGSGRRRDVLPVRVVSGSLGFAPGAYFAADFTWGDQKYRKGVGAGIQTRNFLEIPGATSTGGAGFGTVQRNGVWQSVAANAPLIGDGGLGVWEARAQNNPGPGNPSGWPTVKVTNGVTITREAVGVEFGLPFADYRFVGTPTANFVDIDLAAANPRWVAVPSQPYTVSAAAKLVGGSAANITSVGYVVVEESAGPTYIGLTTASLAAALAGGFTESRAQRNFGSSAAFGRGALVMVLTTGLAIDATIRFYRPNITVGPDINDPPILQTSGLAATRTAVAQSVTGLPAPSGDWTISGSVQLFGDTGAIQRFVDWSDGTDTNKIVVERNAAGAVLFASRLASVTTTVATFNSKTGPRTIDWSFRKVGGQLIARCDGLDAAPSAVTPPDMMSALQLGVFRGGGGGWLNGNLRNVFLRYG